MGEIDVVILGDNLPWVVRLQSLLNVQPALEVIAVPFCL